MTVGRPYSPTDLSHPLIPFLGYPVATADGAVRGVLANIDIRGMATITTYDDVVSAIVPASTVHPALSQEWT